MAGGGPGPGHEPRHAMVGGCVSVVRALPHGAGVRGPKTVAVDGGGPWWRGGTPPAHPNPATLKPALNLDLAGLAGLAG
jgi:hypothetical protein